MKYSSTSTTMTLPSTFIFLVSFLHLFFLSNSNAQSQVHWIEKEKQALLDFKLSFVADPDDFFSTWSNASDDCCSWQGVGCDDLTRHVTSLVFNYASLKSYKLRPSLLELNHLTSLSFTANHLNMRIPKFIASLRNLTSLDLSFAGFFGEIPPHLGNLSNLQFLGLAQFNDPYFWQSNIGLYSHSLHWLSHLSSLETLILSQVNLSKALDWASTLKMLPTLSKFGCASCSLPTPLSSVSHINSSTSLQALDLSYNSVSSVFSYLINGTNILQILDLNHIKSDQDNLHELLDFLIRRSRYSLEVLSLAGNNLNILPFGRIMPLPSLRYLDVSSNNISGSLSEILQFLPPNLTHLDLSSNLLSGTILDAHLSKFFQLHHLSLSNNLLTFKFSEGWVPPFQLGTLELSSCKVGPSFPSWILTQTSLHTLDISNSMVYDIVPNDFWGGFVPNFYSDVEINLSHNNISGMVPNLNLSNKLSDNFDGATIDMSYNAFHGSIPLFLFRAMALDLSNNKFSSFSPLQHKGLDHGGIRAINLSNNDLSGKIPDWIFQFDQLVLLNLENNRLSGTLSEAIGSLWQLTSLHLSNNNFSGEVPVSMKNCTQLTIIELANNKFCGVVPSWVGESIAELVVLALRSNNFHGDMPSSLCHLQSLQILDLSDNRLAGTIPHCLHNFSSMATTFWNKSGSEFLSRNSYFQSDSSSVMWKGKLEELNDQNLEQRNVIDLSGNLLRGEIPIGVTTLKGLRSLDLSRNYLNGSIPDKIGQLISLEALKLSSNRLCGEIPQSLASLTFLGTLNLSNNNLSGRIPTSTQLQSFNASSYDGNPKLCGKPLPAKCPRDEDDDNKQPLSSNDARNEDDESFDIQAFLAALGMGFAFGLLGVVGILHFNRPCRLSFFQLGDNIADRIFVARHSIQSRIKRRLCFRKANEGAADM